MSLHLLIRNCPSFFLEILINKLQIFSVILVLCLTEHKYALTIIALVTDPMTKSAKLSVTICS